MYENLKDQSIEKQKENEEEVFTISDDIRLSWNDADYTREMKKILLPTVQRFIVDSNEQDLFEDNVNITNNDQWQISDILTIEPFHGQLEPYEYGVVTVGFFPPPNTKIRAKAICKIDEGEYESLSIVGTSCKIVYELNKKYVEFGKQVAFSYIYQIEKTYFYT